MADQTTLMGLLKTPSQIRKESQDRMMEESLARSQLMLRGMSGGTTALPGIISSYGAQAAQRGAQAGAGLLRGVAGGIGQAVGGDMGQRISDLGVTAEERQARSAQQVLQNVDQSSPEELEQAAKELASMGLTGASQAIAQRAQTLKLNQAKIGAQEALEQRRELEAQQLQQEIEQGPQPDIGAINPQDYTPESLQAFLKSSNYSDLKLRARPTSENLTPQQKNFQTYTRLLDENKPEQARKFGVSAGIINENLSASLQKDYIATGRSARESSANALRYSELANQIQQVGDQFGAGTAGGWEEGYKNIVGSQDAVSDLKTRYRSVRASAAMDNLPPGAASDADVALALGGVPNENANAETVIRFLSGLAKLEREVNRYQQAKLAYIDKNNKVVGFESVYKAAMNQQPSGVVRTTAGGTSYTIIEE